MQPFDHVRAGRDRERYAHGNHQFDDGRQRTRAVVNGATECRKRADLGDTSDGNHVSTAYRTIPRRLIANFPEWYLRSPRGLLSIAFDVSLDATHMGGNCSDKKR